MKACLSPTQPKNMVTGFENLIKQSIEASPMPKTLLPLVRASESKPEVVSPVKPAGCASSTEESKQEPPKGSVLTQWVVKCLPGHRVVVEGYELNVLGFISPA